MRLRLSHRHFAILAVLALILGFAAQGVAAAGMDAMTMPAANGEMSSSGSCDGCAGGDDAMPSAGCLSFCSGIVAILPVTAVTKTAPAQQARLPDDPMHVGRGAAPDPHPPRAAILS